MLDILINIPILPTGILTFASKSGRPLPYMPLNAPSLGMLPGRDEIYTLSKCIKNGQVQVQVSNHDLHWLGDVSWL